MESAELSPSDDSLDPTDKVPWLHRDEIEDGPASRAAPIARAAPPTRPIPRKPLPLTVPAPAPAPAPANVDVAPAPPVLPTVTPTIESAPRCSVSAAPAKDSVASPGQIVNAPSEVEVTLAPPVLPARRTKRGTRRTRQPRHMVDRATATAPLETNPEPFTFGAGMLQARKGRSERVQASRDVLAHASSAFDGEPRTFGAGILRARTSRAKYIVALMLALAAITAVCLVARDGGGPNKPAAAAPKKT